MHSPQPQVVTCLKVSLGTPIQLQESSAREVQRRRKRGGGRKMQRNECRMREREGWEECEHDEALPPVPDASSCPPRVSPQSCRDNATSRSCALSHPSVCFRHQFDSFNPTWRVQENFNPIGPSEERLTFLHLFVSIN